MTKKHFIIGLITILIIIGLGISFKIVLDFNHETKIKNEVKEIKNAFDSNNFENINEIFDRRLIQTGHYAEVEKSIKLYYKNLYSSLDNINFLFDEDNFNSYLTSKNINDDKPTFIKSKNNLQNSKAQIEECYNKFLEELNNNSNKAAYITNKEMTKYYQNFFFELTNLAISDEFKEKVNDNYKSTLDKISIYNEAFDFLATNKGHWAIQNEAIVFDDTIIYEEYVNITKKLNPNLSDENKEEVSEN